MATKYIRGKIVAPVALWETVVTLHRTSLPSSSSATMWSRNSPINRPGLAVQHSLFVSLVVLGARLTPCARERLGHHHIGTLSLIESVFTNPPRKKEEFKQKNSLSQQTGSTQVRTGAC